jgi:hypothetical protein
MKLLLVLGAIPLLMYPACLGAGLMSLAPAPHFRNEPRHATLSVLVVGLIGYGFIFGSLAYPAVYFVCLVLARYMEVRKNYEAAMRFAAGPLLYLLLLAGLMALGLALGRVMR